MWELLQDPSSAEDIDPMDPASYSDARQPRGLRDARIRPNDRLAQAEL